MDFYSAALLQGLGYAAMGLGIYISLRIFNIPDITTDGSYTFGGVITAVLLVAGFSPAVALAGACAGGALSGLASGLIHTRLKVNPLLAGILVMTALYSINLSIMGRSNLPLTDVVTLFESITVFQDMNANRWLIFLVVTLVVSGALTWLLKTDFGIAMRATGNNEQMVRSLGMNTNTMKVFGLALANTLTALSGYLLVQYQGFADISMGIGIVISGLAAVMLGEALSGFFKTNKILYHIGFVIAGSILFRLILAVTLSLGLNPNYLKLVTAVIVLSVLVLTRFRTKSR
jgi:putative ABC transport system permease protein